MPRRLIVNADDLGYDPAIDRGILEAHARGIVTSATAMVETPFAAVAMRDAPRTLGLGLHLVLEEGLGGAALEGAIRRQLDRFQALRGAAPTHLDGHKHRHARPEALPAVIRVAREAGLPVRAMDAALRARLRAEGVPTADRFLGDADRRPAWTAEGLLAALASLEDGVTELMAHPGYRPSHARTSFGVEREAELAALCDPRARAALAASGTILTSYAELRPSPGRGGGA
ncbi:MAG: ChbG/HpnK family deacetylase [Anaeromyxobacter sp.]